MTSVKTPEMKRSYLSINRIHPIVLNSICIEISCHELFANLIDHLYVFLILDTVVIYAHMRASGCILSSSKGSIRFGLDHYGLICNLSRCVCPLIILILPVVRMSLVLPLTERPALPPSPEDDWERRKRRVSTTETVSQRKYDPTVSFDGRSYVNAYVLVFIPNFSSYSYNSCTKLNFSHSHNIWHWAPSKMKTTQQGSSQSGVFDWTEKSI